MAAASGGSGGKAGGRKRGSDSKKPEPPTVIRTGTPVQTSTGSGPADPARASLVLSRWTPEPGRPQNLFRSFPQP